MKDNKNTDKLLRDKLNGYESPVPAGLFEAIDAQRKEKKSKPLLPWYAAAGAAALTVIAVGLFFFLTETEKENAVQTTDRAVVTTENPTVTAEENSFEINKETAALPSEKSPAIIVEAKTDKTAAVREKTQTITEHKTATAAENKINFIADEKPAVQTEITPVAVTDLEDSQKDFTETAENTPEDTPIAEEKAVLTAEEKAARENIVVSPLASKDFFNTDTRYAAMPKIECGWESRKLYIYFDALTSLDMAFRSFDVRSPESAAYATLRNETEQIQESFSVGFRASVVTANGFAVRTGLNYSKIREPITQRIYEEEARIITTENEFGEVLSIDTIYETNILEFRGRNSHKLLDIPLLVGYEFDRPKYNFAFNTGAYLNILARQQGSILNPAGEIVSIDSDNRNRYNVFKDNVGLSLFGSVAVNYKITPAIHFIFEPYARYYLDSFTLDSHELEQRYFTAGMQVGLRLKM